MEGGSALCEENRKLFETVEGFEMEKRASLGERTKYTFMVFVYLVQGIAVGLLVSPYSATAFTFNRIMGLGVLSLGTFYFLGGLSWLIKPALAKLMKKNRESVLSWFWWSMTLAWVSIVVLAVLFLLGWTGSVTLIWGIRMPPIAFLLLAILCNFGLASMDVVCDNLAFDVVGDKRRGMAEMVMWGPLGIGVLLGQYSVRFINSPMMYGVIILGGGILMLLFGGVAYQIIKKHLTFVGDSVVKGDDLIRRKFSFGPVLWFVSLAVLIELGLRLNMNLLFPWLETYGHGREAASNVLAVSDLVNLAGIFVAGFLTIRFGKYFLIWALMFVAGSYLLLGASSGEWTVFSSVLLLTALIAFAEGVMMVAKLQFFRFASMQVRMISAAVFFQVVMLVLNLVRVGAPLLGALLKGESPEAGVPFSGMFMLAALPLLVAALGLTIAWSRKKLKGGLA